MRSFASLLFVLLFCLGIFSCATGGAPGSSSGPHVFADLYNRYEGSTGKYTAEAKMSLRDSLTGLDTAYAVEGGVAFLGSGLERDIVDDRFIRFRSSFAADPEPAVRYSFTKPNGELVQIEGSLPPFDSLIMGPLPTHNFGFTVYPLNQEDVLLSNETLNALFIPDGGNPQLATISGPSTPGAGYVFKRETIGAWPLSQGTLTFIRRRTTPLSIEGVRGTLTEEVYSKPMRSAVVN